jgi:predicted nucleotidyltransferase
MVRTRERVLQTLAGNREAIRQFGVRSLGLFGSAARDQSTPASDLDFVVEFERNTFDAYMGLKEFLENLFDCPVDLVLAHTLKPRLRDPILRETVHAPGL